MVMVVPLSKWTGDHGAYTLQMNVVCELHVSKLSLRKDQGEWEWVNVRKNAWEPQRENAEFERLGGEQILGCEIRLTPGVPWKLCFINPSLSLWGSCLWYLYINNKYTSLFYTHHSSCVCLDMCSCLFVFACGHMPHAQGNHHCFPPTHWGRVSLSQIQSSLMGFHG